MLAFLEADGGRRDLGALRDYLATPDIVIGLDAYTTYERLGLPHEGRLVVDLAATRHDLDDRMLLIAAPPLSSPAERARDVYGVLERDLPSPGRPHSGSDWVVPRAVQRDHVIGAWKGQAARTRTRRRTRLRPPLGVEAAEDFYVARDYPLRHS